VLCVCDLSRCDTQIQDPNAFRSEEVGGATLWPRALEWSSCQMPGTKHVILANTDDFVHIRESRGLGFK